MRPELFETACKVIAIPMEVKRVWSGIQFFFCDSGQHRPLGCTTWSHEKALKGVSSVPGRNRAKGFQETADYPSQWEHEG